MASCFDWIQPLSWDGVLALIGGVLAFFAVLWQTSRADEGIRRQLEAEKSAREAEKDARAEEAHRRRQAAVTAMLYEMDDFYTLNVAGVRDELAAGRPGLELISASFRFTVYTENAHILGEIHPRLASEIVRFYNAAAAHSSDLSVLHELNLGASRSAPGHPAGIDLIVRVVARIERDLADLEEMTWVVCRMACDFVEREFRNPPFEIADLRNIPASARETIESWEHEFRGITVE